LKKSACTFAAMCERLHSSSMINLSNGHHHVHHLCLTGWGDARVLM
jgi:hypothetical protein